MRFYENWLFFFQKYAQPSQNIMLATFFENKLFQTKYYLKKIMADFRKFIKSISGGKSIFEKILQKFRPPPILVKKIPQGHH